jgi:lysozyme
LEWLLSNASRVIHNNSLEEGTLDISVSSAGLEFIKNQEAFRSNAYLDVARIPTIGYGTTRYADGRGVRLGETISEAEAEVELKSECDRIANQIESSLNGSSVVLNQNEVDALTSFCFNVGTGAFKGSTLLKLLLRNDIPGAADQFLLWDKATVNGELTTLSDLQQRRSLERQMFLSNSPGGSGLGKVVSDAEKVTRAVGFRRGATNIIAAFTTEVDSDTGENREVFLESVNLGNTRPATLSSLFSTYPNLIEFDIASPDDVIPAGPQKSFSGVTPVGDKPEGDAPVFHGGVLQFGNRDSDGDDPSDPNFGKQQGDIAVMQRRLKELLYYGGAVDGIFGPVTDEAVKNFQAEYFGPNEADGKAGKLTWAKLFGHADPSTVDPGQTAPGKNYLKLTMAGMQDQYGLEVLTLANYVDGKLSGTLNVSSGAPGKQKFRTATDSPAKSFEPLPEGEWSVQKVHFFGGTDNYDPTSIFSDGLGPAVMPLDFKGPGTTARSDIEIHIDWNRRTSPGTAGCIGLLSVADYKTLVGWQRASQVPQRLIVDWGKGTAPTP